MSEQQHNTNQCPAGRDNRFRLEFWERRHSAAESAIWQIPALTATGQAFLLVVLVGKDTSKSTAGAAMSAGLLATLAAALALSHFVALERRLSCEVDKLAETEGIGPTKVKDLWTKERRCWAERRAKLMWIVFGVVLALAVADVFAFLAH